MDKATLLKFRNYLDLLVVGKQYPIEMTFKGYSRSSEMSRFDRVHVISYYRSVVTLALSFIVSHI